MADHTDLEAAPREVDLPAPNLPLLRKKRICGMTERFWEQVSFDRTTGCAQWNGRLLRGGYGLYRHMGKMQLVHRAVFEEMVGPVPDRMTLDHLCGNESCISVDHLDVVTLRENVQRAKRGITHCKQGHPFDAENTAYSSRGSRRCKACGRERSATDRAAEPDKVRAYQAAKAREYRAARKANES